jgi:hypothetical protein
MTHLSPAEFVDAAEGALGAPRAAHLEACAGCRRELAGVTAALDAARGVGVPEPSPLYWQHQAARIREAVASEPILPSWRAAYAWRPGVRRLVPLASAGMLAAALVLAVALPRGGVTAPAATTIDAGSAEASVPPEDSEAWQVLTSAADETPMDEAHAAGMTVPAGAVDRAVQRMSPEELHALGQLLQRELRRAGA